MTEEQILDSFAPTERRRKLLPVWIKFFLWVFMVFGAIAPLGLIFGVFGYSFNLSLYGLEAFNPLSVSGLLIIFLYSLKGAVSFGLWTEKDWAVQAAIVDAIIGIVFCTGMMVLMPFFGGSSFELRIELVALIPYLMKMNKIKGPWADNQI